jgi:type IV pilus assembly protein PilW
MMRTSPRPRGFTLIELVIALGMSALVIASALVLMVGQQRAFRAGSDDRALQEIARVALSRVAGDLRAAGYGVDPALAFDFGAMSAVAMKQKPDGVTVNAATFRCDTPLDCRDKIDGPDEIVFLSRDPNFAKPLRAAAVASSTKLTVAGPLNTPLHPGQILQVMCYSAPMTWAYVTVSAEVAATAATVKSVEIPIESGSTYDFPGQNAAFADGCFSQFMAVDPPYLPDDDALSAAAKVFKVDRYRYFVRRYDGRPYLMLDRGGPDATPQLEVIAPDVEDIQFSYVFPNATASTLVAATSGVKLSDDAGVIELAPANGFPAYGDDPKAASQTNHQAGNIRAVRVSIVVRTPSPDPSHPDGAEYTTIPAAANRPALGGDPGYRRLLIETTVPTPNLGGKAPSFPMYGTAANAFNVGGG